MTIHKPEDKVQYNSNKTVWIKFHDKTPEQQDTFKFGNVPFMASGEHHPRYEKQKQLYDIYVNHHDDLVNKLVEHNLLFKT